VVRHRVTPSLNPRSLEEDIASYCIDPSQVGAHFTNLLAMITTRSSFGGLSGIWCVRP
jgi:hypothetical protein